MTQPTISRSEVERIAARAAQTMDELQYESVADTVARLCAALSRAMGLLRGFAEAGDLEIFRVDHEAELFSLLTEWDRDS